MNEKEHKLENTSPDVSKMRRVQVDAKTTVFTNKPKSADCDIKRRYTENREYSSISDLSIYL